MSMNALLGSEGAKYSVSFNGKEYNFSRIDQLIKGVFEAKILSSKICRLEAARELYSEEEYQTRRAKYFQEYDNGEYSLLAPGTLQQMEKPEYAFMLISSILDGKHSDGEIIGLLLVKKDEIIPLVKQIIRESFPGLESVELKKEPK